MAFVFRPFVAVLKFPGEVLFVGVTVGAVGGAFGVVVEDDADEKQAAPNGEVPTCACIPVLKYAPDYASRAG